MTLTLQSLRNILFNFGVLTNPYLHTNSNNPTHLFTHSDDGKLIEKLIAGDSVIRDNVKVLCKGGALISDLNKLLLSSMDLYGKLMLMLGTNDAFGKAEISSILEDYGTLLETAKKKAVFVRVSGLCPRGDDGTYFECAVLINSGLEELCKKKDFPYIDNMPSFMLQNGSVNDGYLLPKVHTSAREEPSDSLETWS